MTRRLLIGGIIGSMIGAAFWLFTLDKAPPPKLPLLPELALQSVGLVPTAPVPARITQTLRVNSGDNLMTLLIGAGIKRAEAHRAIEAMERVYSPRKIKPGFRITVETRPPGAGRLRPLNSPLAPEPGQLSGFSFVPDVERIVAVVRRGQNSEFEARITKRPLTIRQVYRTRTIESSLYQSAVQAGLRANVIDQLIRIYSYDVDFQRDIRAGDRFEVIFNSYDDDTGAEVKSGDILYSKLTLSGTDIRLYRFEQGTGFDDYYNEKGQSAKKALMRTPIDGARLSSRFGRRKHPVLGYTKLHKGIDFAAPRGTPIYAAGDGMVERANRFGSYGNYIRIRHAGGLKTAYAHLKGFAAGISANKRVKQGQVIGYVGTTGRSTGPHLHYEVLRNGRQINPLKIKVSSGKPLTGEDKVRFATEREKIDQLRATLKPAAATDKGQ